MAKFKYPTHQINFCTKEALKCLEYRGFEAILIMLHPVNTPFHPIGILVKYIKD